MHGCQPMALHNSTMRNVDPCMSEPRHTDTMRVEETSEAGGGSNDTSAVAVNVGSSAKTYVSLVQRDQRQFPRSAGTARLPAQRRRRDGGDGSGARGARRRRWCGGGSQPKRGQKAGDFRDRSQPVGGARRFLLQDRSSGNRFRVVRSFPGPIREPRGPRARERRRPAGRGLRRRVVSRRG